mgnify:CR=1 FL=1
MNYFVAKVRYYDELSKDNETAYHVIAADSMSDAIQRISNYYDEANLLDVKVSYIHSDVCEITKDMYNTLLEERE